MNEKKTIMAVPESVVQLNHIGLRRGDLLISITSRHPGATHPKLIKGVKTLRIRHDDIQEPLEFGTQVLTPMTVEEAREVWEFVETHLRRVRRVVVHCYAGLSRSPAVAIALAEIFQLEPGHLVLMAAHPSYNRTVHAVMMRAATER